MRLIRSLDQNILRIWLGAAIVFVLLYPLVRWVGDRYLIDLQTHPCLPWRLYESTALPSEIGRGDMVRFDTLKMRVATVNQGVKLVGGLPGDRVDVRNHEMFINGRLHVRLFICDKTPVPQYCRDRSYVIQPGEYLVFGTDEHSFDSRYWDTLRAQEIKGGARPIL